MRQDLYFILLFCYYVSGWKYPTRLRQYALGSTDWARPTLSLNGIPPLHCEIYVVYTGTVARTTASRIIPSRMRERSLNVAFYGGELPAASCVFR